MSVRRQYLMDKNAALGISSSLTCATIVFNNKTFEMCEVPTYEEAVRLSFQPDVINCGENIKLRRQYAI